MRVSIKLNLQKVLDNIATFTGGFDITFDNISNLTDWSDDHAPFIASEVTNLNLYGDEREIDFLITAGQEDEELVDDSITDVSTNGNSISFTCDIMDNELSMVLDLIKKECIELDQFGKTNIIAYRLNDEKDKLSKTLIPVTILEGKFTAPLGIKSLELDVVNYDINNSYNYVYIPKLKRYFYITNIQLSTKDYTRLLLQEDVLMSHADLIRSQSAFVSRYGNSKNEDPTNNYLVDDRYPLLDRSEVSYFKPSMTTGVTVVNFKYVMDTVGTTKKPSILCKTSTDIITFLTGGADISAPTNSGLPNIENMKAGTNKTYLLNADDYEGIVKACLQNDAPATYIHSIMLLPFDLGDIVPSSYLRNSHLMAGDKGIGYGASGIQWKALADLTDSDPLVPEANLDKFPYIVVADFTFSALGNITLNYDFLDYAPNTLWEIYIPFVGWIPLDPVAVIGKRIMVYFTVDFDTGLSTCYIYNRTDKKVLWSGSCQLGMKLSLAVSNADELARQKQATSLNLIMGLVSSMLSMGIGGATANPVAMVGGVMGMGNTIVNAVNSYNSMIEKAQITFGSSDNALFSPNEIIVRKTTHAKLITTTAEENKYKALNGYPYKRYVLLSSLNTGNYIEVGEIHFNANGNNIYQTEIDEIVALLKNGVIL